MCYGAKPFSSGDEKEEDLIEKPVRRRRKKRQKTKYNLRQLENQEDRKLAARFWKQNKSFVWKGSCFSIKNTVCSVRLERVPDPESDLELRLSSDSVDDLIKSSSCSEGRTSKSSKDDNSKQLPTRPRFPQPGTEARAQKQKKSTSPRFPAMVVDDDDVKPLLGRDGQVLPSCSELSRPCVSQEDIDIIDLLGSSDSSEEVEEKRPPTSSSASESELIASDLEQEEVDERSSNINQRGDFEGNDLSKAVEVQSQAEIHPDESARRKSSESARRKSSEVDILDLISSDLEEEEAAAPIIYLSTMRASESSRTLTNDPDVIETDDEDYLAVMAAAENVAKRDNREEKTEKTKPVAKYRPGPASSKKGMPSIVYDLSSDDNDNDQGNEADVEDDDLVDVSDSEDENSYLNHRSSSFEDLDSDGNSYLDHRGDTSDELDDGCEENCENLVVIEEDEEKEEEEGAVCIIGEIRNETIEDEDQETSNRTEGAVEIDEREIEKTDNNNHHVETIDGEGEQRPSSPAPFVISEVRTGIGTEAENDWDDILVEDIDARQSSVEPESTPRSHVNQHRPPLNNRQRSSGGPEVVRLSPPREMPEPEITLLPITSTPDPRPSTSNRTRTSTKSGPLSSSATTAFRSTFAGIAPCAPQVSGSLLLEPPEQRGLSPRSQRPLGNVDTAKEGPRSEWEAGEVQNKNNPGTSSGRRQEWDTHLRLHTVSTNSGGIVPKKKKRKGRGKKKSNSVVDSTVQLEHGEEVEALN